MGRSIHGQASASQLKGTSRPCCFPLPLSMSFMPLPPRAPAPRLPLYSDRVQRAMQLCPRDHFVPPVHRDEALIE